MKSLSRMQKMLNKEKEKAQGKKKKKRQTKNSTKAGIIVHNHSKDTKKGTSNDDKSSCEMFEETTLPHKRRDTEEGLVSAVPLYVL